MRNDLAITLMQGFADATGVSGNSKPHRYLWTDAFAVCNFLGLYRQTGVARYLTLAKELVDQVHHILGRHRADDARRGWISGLPENEGEMHPTMGGLRIGKKWNERKRDEPFDAQLEWDRDGQYFHYLTKWMHALSRLGQETGERHYERWAVELAVASYKAFAHKTMPAGSMQLVWKMSIDLSRVLVPSVGQHDALDGYVTFLELQANADDHLRQDLNDAIAGTKMMCAHGNWATEDPLGIGGLLDNAKKLAQMIVERKLENQELVQHLLSEAAISLRLFSQASLLRKPASHRLPFRELGLAIGIQGFSQINSWLSNNSSFTALCRHLLQYLSLANQIQEFWADSKHRLQSTWTDHAEINTVMLATCLAPGGYSQL